MADIDGPVTKAKVEALASEWADDPTTVVEIAHSGFTADTQSGGYAFVCDRGLLIYGYDGSAMWSVDPGNHSSRIQKVEQYWRKSQHRNRPLGLKDVSHWHRAAIAALTSGNISVADLPPAERAGIADTDRADYLLVLLRGFATEPTEAGALRALAARDWLLRPPRDRNRAHPCPTCGLPAIGQNWEYSSVCAECHPATTCSHGRLVTGHNTSLMGGFQARHVDDASACDQVTWDGRVWIDGQECHMGEAKFGGTFVGVGPW